MRQRQNRLRWQPEKLKAQLQACGCKEQRHKEPLGRAPHARHNVSPHLIRQRGQGCAKEQRAKRTVQSGVLRYHYDQEETSQQHTKRQLRYLKKVLQYYDNPRKYLCGE